MHEAGIASNIIAIAEQSAKQNALESITSIEIDIGAFSSVQIDALKFALEALKPGTVLANTSFLINDIPILLHCRKCDNHYNAAINDLLCPACNQADYFIIQGKEMLVKTITGEKQKHAQ